jgi:hypothetical protein
VDLNTFDPPAASQEILKRRIRLKFNVGSLLFAIEWNFGYFDNRDKDLLDKVFDEIEWLKNNGDAVWAEKIEKKATGD